MLNSEEIKIIDEYSNNYIPIKYRDDFKQHIFLLILELPILDNLRKRGKNINYIYSVMKKQNYSKSSTFFNIYKKWDKNREDITNE